MPKINIEVLVNALKSVKPSITFTLIMCRVSKYKISLINKAFSFINLCVNKCGNLKLCVIYEQ